MCLHYFLNQLALPNTCPMKYLSSENFTRRIAAVKFGDSLIGMKFILMGA
jgi:hypothetical protein